MPNKGDIRHLAGHLNEPVVKDKVLGWLRDFGGPALFREILSGSGVHKAAVIRVLSRAVKKGVVSRYKIPIAFGQPRPRRLGPNFQPGGATRQLYLYSYEGDA